MKKRLEREEIAARASREIKEGDYVNLGVGIPNLCANYIRGKDVILHAEQGLLDFGPLLNESEWDLADSDYVDAGGFLIKHKTGLTCFDLGLSFDMIRGGHLDITMMGALEVSEKGDLANWTRGDVELAGIGGSLDLAVGAKQVIICMEHTTKNGGYRIVKECQYPLTAKACVKKVITDLAVLEIGSKGIVLREYAPSWTIDEIQSLTEPKLLVADDVKEMQI